MRTTSPPRKPLNYQSTNRGKLSVALNLATAEGQEMVRALADDLPGGGPQKVGVAS